MDWTQVVLGRLVPIGRQLHYSDWDADVWAIYRLGDERTETNDFAVSHPDKRAELTAMWQQHARRYSFSSPEDSRLEDSPLERVMPTRAQSTRATLLWHLPLITVTYWPV